MNANLLRVHFLRHQDIEDVRYFFKVCSVNKIMQNSKRSTYFLILFPEIDNEHLFIDDLCLILSEENQTKSKKKKQKQKYQLQGIRIFKTESRS